MLVHTYDPSTLEAEIGGRLLSLGPAWAWDPVLKEWYQKKKEK